MRVTQGRSIETTRFDGFKNERQYQAPQVFNLRRENYRLPSRRRGGLLPILFSILLISLLLPCVASAADIQVFNQRIEVAKPDGSGVAFIRLQADTSDPHFNTLTGFRIAALRFIAGQQLTLYDTINLHCNGDPLSVGDDIPIDGKVCFHSDTSVYAEFENDFTFYALSSSGSTSNVNATVQLINYDEQLCQGIPDLGTSMSFRAPPTPSVAVVLSGLQIRFIVNAAYIRNETTWLLDFFDFDIAPSTGDSADGAGRTCANHNPTSFPADFADWWATAPRATYDSSLHPTIADALSNDGVYPIYSTSATRWSVVALDCSTVQYVATIPISRLIRNMTTDCKNGNNTAPATTSNGLTFSGTLYAHALRPRDTADRHGGYFKTSFLFPFSFSMQETVSTIGTVSTRWMFTTNVLNLFVDRSNDSPGLTLELQTTIQKPQTNSPDLTGAVVLSAPYLAVRTINVMRTGDNGQCSGSSESACVVYWRISTPELTLEELDGNSNAFAVQYVGSWLFQFTVDSDKRDENIQVRIYIDSSAADPDVNLDQVPTTTTVSFFKSREDMQSIEASGGTSETPVFSSGEQIWVRHSFSADPADVTAFTLTLKEAYICWSHIPGFVPSLSTGGCSADIPGVMELSQGQRIRLYDSTLMSQGIADVLDGASPKPWNWTIVPPTDPAWNPSGLVHNGFGINALPLASDTYESRTYYFHVVSTVSQTTLSGRRNPGVVRHAMISARSGKTSSKLATIIVAASEDGAGFALRPEAPMTWVYEQLF